MRVTRDYNARQYKEFETRYANREKALMDFTSQCSVTSLKDKHRDKDDYIFSSSIPIGRNDGDYAVCIFARIDDDVITVLDMRMF